MLPARVVDAQNCKEKSSNKKKNQRYQGVSDIHWNIKTLETKISIKNISRVWQKKAVAKHSNLTLICTSHLQIEATSKEEKGSKFWDQVKGITPIITNREQY